ncbi:hypothetical protein MXD81_58515 [Microbacteriaceae bacterium K1510]|nr:hypothetical protein [Microbacteriaceae bacterium K1510]
MRKFFYGLGIVAAVVIVCGAVGLFVLFRNGASLDADSRAYVDAAAPRIVADWSAEELWKRASPRLRATAKREQIEAFFNAAKGALGPLAEYRGSQGQAFVSVVNAHTNVSGNYVVQCTFQKGSATLRISVVKQDEQWMIEGFHIDSSQIMQQLVGVKS